MEYGQDDTASVVLAGRKVGIFGKGGAGKSTVTVLLARTLYASGLDVVVVDADPTNTGLPRALGFDDEPRALIEHFGGMVFAGGKVTCPVDDPEPLDGALVDLETLDASFVAGTSRLRLLTLGKMGGLGAGAGCDGPITKIARDLRVRDGQNDPVTLIDFKAGFEDSSRGVLLGIDLAVAVVDPTPAAIRMALDLDAAVAALREGVTPATAHFDDPARADVARALYRTSRVRAVIPLLNRVPDVPTASLVRHRLEGLAVAPGPVLREEGAIARAWIAEEELPRPGSSRAIDHLVDELADRAHACDAGGATLP